LLPALNMNTQVRDALGFNPQGGSCGVGVK
jgi:hypothetical protein